jgi:hypothetical protein
LAGGCYWLAEYYVIRGLQNCTGLFSMTIPKNCAREGTTLAQRVFGIASIGLLLLAVFLPFFAVWRHNKFTKDETDSIKITE